MSSLEEVCEQLRRFGIDIDPEAIRRTNGSEEQLERVERNLWEMLKKAEAERARR